jgi:hypothetical protein
MTLRHTNLVVAALLLPAAFAGAQSASSVDSARVAVQRFYDWYLPRQAKPAGRDMVMYAATNGPLAFNAEVVRWLRIDSTARARNRNEIDGLDGDPFLNAQDPCDRYQVQDVTRRNGQVWVNVRGTGGCARHEGPDVIVVLQPSLKGFIVRDFLDPQHHNRGLIVLLRELHAKAK